MFNLTTDQIRMICDAKMVGHLFDKPINQIIYDSRLIHLAKSSMFVALNSERQDGHNFISVSYQKGIRVFLVTQAINISLFPEACFLIVHDVIKAIQKLAVYHRNLYHPKVIGITGSNGKTIVKEWVTVALNQKYKVVQSPQSYNSQLGVALSMFGIESHHQIAVIEAGISQKGEMQQLEAMIRPDIGIFTNLGTAHAEGFDSSNEKLIQKLQLFKNAFLLIIEKKEIFFEAIRNELPNISVFSWSIFDHSADVFFQFVKKESNYSQLKIFTNSTSFNVTLPYIDDAYLTNAYTVITLLIYLGFSPENIQAIIPKFEPIKMRLEFKKGILNSTLINDSYNSDMNSISIAINTANQFSHDKNKVFIISDVFQKGQEQDGFYDELSKTLIDSQPSIFIGIGQGIQKLGKQLEGKINFLFYLDTETFLTNFDIQWIKNSLILIKGSRKFLFEKIVEKLEFLSHHTELEINLSSIQRNLKQYQSQIKRTTKIMAMVKAGAYGSGSIEVSRILQQNHIDYLAVAYLDEGVELRQAGITVPIMVMNTQVDFYERLIIHELEPEIFSITQLNQLIYFLMIANQKMDIHIKIDTGMHRLGFESKNIDELISKLVLHPMISVKSIFSHLSASGEDHFDDFTLQQLQLFEKICLQITQKIGYRPLCHILNTGGILRFPEHQLDMVRLGIGLYGINPTDLDVPHEHVFTLKSKIAQIKTLEKGEAVGYSLRWVTSDFTRIATISIGYADGLFRAAGNGRCKVNIRGHAATIVGSVCMDMCMIDITHIPEVVEGDEVIIFGSIQDILLMSNQLQTIPYELLTNISPRVKRTYILE